MTSISLRSAVENSNVPRSPRECFFKFRRAHYTHTTFFTIFHNSSSNYECVERLSDSKFTEVNQMKSHRRERMMSTNETRHYDDARYRPRMHRRNVAETALLPRFLNTVRYDSQRNYPRYSDNSREGASGNTSWIRADEWQVAFRKNSHR